MDSDTHATDWAYRSNDVLQCYNDYLIDRNNLIRNKSWSHVDIDPIKIGDRSWIGFNVTILKGVTIGCNTIIGAGSVVTHSIPDFAVFAGNPARLVRYIENR
jgi:galactoside O-acetyltransferase